MMLSLSIEKPEYVLEVALGVEEILEARRKHVEER
jgi:hypothetical protein